MSPAKESRVAVSATKLLINNRWVPSESGKTFATINPSTGEEICQIAEADAADVEKAVRAARAAFEHGPWRKTAGIGARTSAAPSGRSDREARRRTGRAGIAGQRQARFGRQGRGRRRHGRLLPLFRRLGRQGSRQNDSHRRRLLLLHAARTGRRGGADHSLELPHADAGLEARARRWPPATRW